ncbi:hypothetical protein Tco_0782342, partial [Tanacetum coccineum]
IIQQAAREEAWVPKADRVKISTTNMRIDLTMTQKEETYQIKDTNLYEFKLANKKCLVDVEVFRQALDICPRVPGKEFIVPPPEEELLTFLIGLRYNGVLTHLPQMFIDHMHQPWRTRASIINKCLSGKTTNNGVLSRTKFVRIGEDVQEYGRAIPDTMLTNDIKQSETYQMFIKYSTCLIPLKKTRGKGSQGKKAAVSKKPASVEVSDESNSEPSRKQISSRKVIKKKVLISAEDNIIPKPDVALELRKSMILTESAEEEAIRQVHATHERIVTESDPEPAKRRPSGIAFRDTSNVSKKISSDPSQKKKGIQTLTPKEQLAANTMQALKASRSQSLTRGSNEGTGVSPRVPNESTVILTTSSEGTGTKPGIDCMYSDEKEEKKDDDDDDKSIDIEETEDEETDDEFVQGDEYVQENVNEEMKYTEVNDTRTVMKNY